MSASSLHRESTDSLIVYARYIVNAVGWPCKMSTYSASGERILQVADPKLLKSVDCSKSIMYLHSMI